MFLLWLAVLLRRHDPQRVMAALASECLRWSSLGRLLFWSAVDLHVAVMPRICDALGRLIVGRHPESGTGPDGENRAARGRSCR